MIETIAANESWFFLGLALLTIALCFRTRHENPARWRSAWFLLLWWDLANASVVSGAFKPTDVVIDSGIWVALYWACVIDPFRQARRPALLLGLMACIVGLSAAADAFLLSDQLRNPELAFRLKGGQNLVVLLMHVAVIYPWKSHEYALE